MSPKPMRGGRLHDLNPLKRHNLTSRAVAVPAIGIIMGTLLFIYARSSIYAAKWNAKNHREADGGQISWRKESQRRHGVLKKPDEALKLRDLIKGPQEEKIGETKRDFQPSKEEEAVRARRFDHGGIRQ